MPLIILLFWSFSVYADTQDTTADQEPDRDQPFDVGDVFVYGILGRTSGQANGPLQVNLTYRF
jgi:hypothetical protein